MLQKTENITWKGIENNTIENCQVRWVNESIIVDSSIRGDVKNMDVAIDYTLRLNDKWVIKSFDLKSNINNSRWEIGLESDGEGRWGVYDEFMLFEPCIDIDISLSPFTNSLPINRVEFNLHQPVQLTILYIDVLEQKMFEDKQVYTKQGATKFVFENDDRRFKAMLDVDRNGFVVHYPGLFFKS